jgi:hypothetical protein
MQILTMKGHSLKGGRDYERQEGKKNLLKQILSVGAFSAGLYCH